MRPMQRRRPELQYGLVLLASQVLNFGVDKIPPATLTLIVLQSLLYLGYIQVPWNAEDVCISAKKIIDLKDWHSFFLSNFEHGSDMHLYYNMISFILKGAYLEPMYGTANFVLLIAILSMGCSAMYSALGYILMQITEDYAYYTDCAIGFSSVLFALKVIVSCEERDRMCEIGCCQVPSRFSAWAELMLIHLLVPNASFIGHLGGILFGCLYCYTRIGRMIDIIITAITGIYIYHEEEFYFRRSAYI